MPVLTSQLQMPSVRQGAPSPVSQQPNVPTGQSNQTRMGFTNAQMRPVQRSDGGYTPVLIQGQLRGATSPFSAPPPASPLSRSSVPSPLSQNVPSPMALSNQGPIIQDTGGLSQGMPQGPPTPGQQAAMQGIMMKEKRKLWSGTIEYQEKPPMQQSMNSTTQQKVASLLSCTITLANPNPELEASAEMWPNKLVLSAIPRTILHSLSSVLKNESHLVTFEFNNQESEAYQKLSKALSGAARPNPNAPNAPVQNCGCIQFNMRDPAVMRVMIVVYAPDKKNFMGFIPMNQDAFFTKLRNAIDQFKEQAKHRMMMAGGPNAPGQMQQPGQQQQMMGQAQMQQPQMVQQQPMQPPPGTIQQQIPMSQPQIATNPTGFYQVKTIALSRLQKSPLPWDRKADLEQHGRHDRSLY